MKNFFNRWVYAYAITNILFLFIAFVILRRLNITVSYLNLTLGAVFISLCIGSSITIFKAPKLNAVVRTLGGFLFILPIMFIMRRVFGVMVFRFSFLVYLFVFLCSAVYAVAVAVAAKKAKDEEKALNELLRQRQEKLDKEKALEEDKSDGNFFSVK